MKVNQNISAVISNSQLLRTENNLTASIEKLSSGYKINSAKDNPAGMAISNKMRAQIDALNQSSQNASDGTSVLQTADGALNETTSILQRMRELAVQAASDSMTVSDKQACQQEIESLKDEVDRIANDTEFNSKSLLNGTQDRRIYSDVSGISNFHSSDEVSEGDYELTLLQAPKQASETGVAVAAGQTVSINGYEVSVSNSASDSEIYEQLRNAGEQVGVNVTKNATAGYDFVTSEYGSDAQISLQVGTNAYASVTGSDAKVKLTTSTDGFSKSATASAKGQTVTVTDANGFELAFDVNPADNAELANVSEADATTQKDIKLDITDMGAMSLQVGAHENQEIEVKIPSVTCEALYLKNVNLVQKDGASKAISTLDDAIAQVNETRSRIGASQNRLDYAVSSLDETQENMESAVSRVMDTDMATEMSTYSNLNVLDQAAISVLTQANDMPQKVLQLLQ